MQKPREVFEKNEKEIREAIKRYIREELPKDLEPELPSGSDIKSAIKEMEELAGKWGFNNDDNDDDDYYRDEDNTIQKIYDEKERGIYCYSGRIGHLYIEVITDRFGKPQRVCIEVD